LAAEPPLRTDVGFDVTQVAAAYDAYSLHKLMTALVDVHFAVVALQSARGFDHHLHRPLADLAIAFKSGG
jgi:hypothetical protein